MVDQQMLLTDGNVKTRVLRFALPYMLACFLQTFYGLADLFVVGLYNGSEVSTAVSIGSQVMHFMTVTIAGLAMGTTVELSHSTGAGDTGRCRTVTGNSITAFSILALVLTTVLIFSGNGLTRLMMTPVEAVNATNDYLRICFAGLPFIIAFNLICSIYRGAGDSRRPMYFVAVACLVNIIIDFWFVGGLGMGASGAALGTVTGQGVSVLSALIFLKRTGPGFRVEKNDLIPGRECLSVIKVGLPIALQDGLIQVAFIVITVIANSRGLIDSVSVGIVEKLISFLFLVPSAFLAAVSAFTAQNLGGGRPDRARECLSFSILVTTSWGALCCICSWLFPHILIGLFRTEPAIISAAGLYLKSYSTDCIFAAVHFCFSGYFNGCQKSWISFLHNILSVTLVRVPGTYIASMLFKDTLFPMGLAAPAGSIFSIIICLAF